MYPAGLPQDNDSSMLVKELESEPDIRLAPFVDSVLGDPPYNTKRDSRDENSSHDIFCIC